MKLLDQVRQKLRLLHYSLATERSYVGWIERFIKFHKRGDLWRHPAQMGAPEIEQYLGYLATERLVSASTQNQAFGALLFLYQKVLEIELPAVNAPRAKRTKRVPVVLSTDEVKRLLSGLAEFDTREPYALMARLMYGTGMRLMECCRLRVKDVDFARQQLIVRQGKGDKDRVVPFPASARGTRAPRANLRPPPQPLLPSPQLARPVGLRAPHDLLFSRQFLGTRSRSAASAAGTGYQHELAPRA